MKNTLVFALSLLLASPVFCQTVQISGQVRDREGGPLQGATVSVPTLKMGAVADSLGNFTLNLPAGDSIELLTSFVGYQAVSQKILPENFSGKLFFTLADDSGELEEITISTTRTNARIEDLPVKVEVLGLEELEEESGLVPSNIGSLIGDLSVITIQRTSATTGNDAVRMQGLAPGYTQLLQDGLPLYGGFSGSLGVLNIPPLDLRQVEIIKGSSSTLYGGGAIGGLINFLSKTPGAKPKSTALLNVTTLGETDANVFFSRKTSDTQGYTLFASGTLKPARDINSDGFAEVPSGQSFLVHPHWFWGLGKKSGGDVSAAFSQGHLEAGDFEAIKNHGPFGNHQFYQNETDSRLTLTGQFHRPVSENATWTLRGAASSFWRKGTENYLTLDGRQANTYLETNVLWKTETNDWVLGANLTGEFFKFQSLTSDQMTSGLFAQLDHRLSKKLSLEAGLRADYHNRYGTFLLPRLSLLYKPAPPFSVRLGYGRGYKTPDVFNAVDLADFPTSFALSDPLPDIANSLNMDVNFQKLLFDALVLEVNQAFYFVALKNPFQLTEVNDPGHWVLVGNAPDGGFSVGTDTYIRLKFKHLEGYFGYNHTLSRTNLPDGSYLNEPFNPQDKVAATLAFEIPEKWRFGIEAALSANQFVLDERHEGTAPTVWVPRKVPNFLFMAAVVSRQFSWGKLVLNCENLLDERQSKSEPLVNLDHSPFFSPIWGPLEGRVVNFSVKIDW